jgi:hypothetical protein
MPTIFAANESSVLVNGTAVEGVRALEYSRQQARESLYALGSSERIGVVSGASIVHGRLTVVSTSPTLDGLAPNTPFQISAQLRHGDAKVNVTFDECFTEDKTLGLSVGGQAEATYAFTATRVREEAG